MNIKVEIADPKDLEAIADIYKDEFSKPPYNEKWTFKSANEKLNIFSKYCEIYKIVLNNEIIGFIIINSNHWCPGEIVFGEDMAIREKYQNKGVGRFVFEFIFNIYKKKGYKTFMGIANKDSKAIHLYKKLGLNESKKNFVIEKDLD